VASFYYMYVVPRVRRFRLKFFFTSKRNVIRFALFSLAQAKIQDHFFSLVFASNFSFRFEAKRKKQFFRFVSLYQIFFSLNFLQSQTFEYRYRRQCCGSAPFLYRSDSIQKISMRLQWLRLLFCYVVRQHF
jgi:hypothetical protein